MTMRARVVTLSLFASLLGQAHANAFLSRYEDRDFHEKASISFEGALLGELETILGSEHRTFTEKRLSKLENVVQPIFRAMPKNEHGQLAHAAVSYVLHRVFVHRHGWIVRGLDPEGGGKVAWNDTSPVTLLTDRVPEYVQSTFEGRLGNLGLGVHEIAVLAATLEHLVHKEAIERLQLAYKVHQLSPEDVTSIDEVPKILDTYMAAYIAGFLIRNTSEANPETLKRLSGKIIEIYPTWPDTQAFIREVQESVAPKRDYLYFSDMASVVEEAGERYGRWQDLECRGLKDTLLAAEDTGPGGAGRVRLSDFYRLAMHGGHWQFSESISYLRKLGALDESDPKNPRVMITNYLYGPSNHVASSSYYEVGCIDECETLLAQMEDKLAKPEASPIEISAIATSLLSANQQNSRMLSPWLLQRLDDIATHHGGKIPLHGRLFSQWLHFAYPRDCPYPHVSGTTKPGSFGAVITSSEAVTDSMAEQEEMQYHMDSQPARVEEILNVSAHEELTIYSMEEELVVSRPSAANQVKASDHVSSLLRGAAFFGATLATAVVLVRNYQAYAFEHHKVVEKYYV